MDVIKEVALPVFVWLGLVGLVLIFVQLTKWARKQKGAALAFGLLVQMFLPDPKIQQTIECVSESKKEQHQQQKDTDDIDKSPN